MAFVGCKEFDDSDLWDAVNEQAQRIAALETWQTTVNGNISSLQSLIAALENNDYVTGVTPVTESGATVGYTITFTKSSPVTIYHGTDGADGKDGADGEDGATPIIGVAQHTDGRYYWTLDGDWLLDGGGAMIPATGADGKDGADGQDGQDGAPGGAGTAPQVKIDTETGSATLNQWLISTDGGATWEPTGVNATGPTGPRGATGAKGAQGDAIFAADGIDNTNADYVVFTLADNTEIKLPKYKTVGISFTQPTLFLAGTAQDIDYTIPTGSTAPTNIRIVDLPAGWKYSVVYTTGSEKITVTPPAAMTVDNSGGIATVLAGIGDQVAAMYNLELTSTGFLTNAIGEPFYENGAEVGWIYREATTGNPGLIVSDSRIRVLKVEYVGATLFDLNVTDPDYDTGKELFDALKATIPNDWGKISMYADAAAIGNEWFIPTQADLDSSVDGHTSLTTVAPDGKLMYVTRIRNEATTTWVTLFGFEYGFGMEYSTGGIKETSGGYSQISDTGGLYCMREYSL